MGFFDSVHYSQTEHQLTEEAVKHHITYIKIPSLSEHHDREKLVQDTILARRHSDGKISLQTIYELLTHLKDANTITKYDRDGAMKELQQYFDEHFGV